MDITYTQHGTSEKSNDEYQQPKLLYTKREAAQLLSFSMRSIDYFSTNREIASRRVGRLVLIHGDAIEQFAQRGHVCVRQNKAVRAAGTLAIRRAG
jgi:hypothetical protein